MQAKKLQQEAAASQKAREEAAAAKKAQEQAAAAKKAQEQAAAAKVRLQNVPSARPFTAVVLRLKNFAVPKSSARWRNAARRRS